MKIQLNIFSKDFIFYQKSNLVLKAKQCYLHLQLYLIWTFLLFLSFMVSFTVSFQVFSPHITPILQITIDKLTILLIIRQHYIFQYNPVKTLSTYSQLFHQVLYHFCNELVFHLHRTFYISVAIRKIYLEVFRIFLFSFICSFFHLCFSWLLLIPSKIFPHHFHTSIHNLFNLYLLI